MNTFVVSTIILLVVIFTTLLVLVFWIFSKKQSGIKKLNNFVEEIKKLELPDTDILEFDTLVYDDGLFDSKLTSTYVKTRINDGIIFIEELLDFKKLRMENPFIPRQVKISIDKDKIKWTDSYETTIDLKNLLYIKAYYELTKNALFIEFILINQEQNKNKFQVLNIKDISNINNFILKIKKQ